MGIETRKIKFSLTSKFMYTNLELIFTIADLLNFTTQILMQIVKPNSLPLMINFTKMMLRKYSKVNLSTKNFS